MPEPMTGTRRNASTAMGPGTTATGAKALAYGYKAAASGSNATAIGYTARATGSNATALAYNASASDNNTTALGYNASASASGATAIGYTASASTSAYNAISVGVQSATSASGAIAIGYNASASGIPTVAIGYSANASGASATALGESSVANRAGTHARSSGYFAAAGDAQDLTLVARVSTTNNTATELAGNGSTGYFTIAASQTYSFTALVAARRTDATGESAMWEIRGCIARDSSGNCRAVGSWTGNGTPLFSDAGSSTWQVNVTADTTNNRLAITATGENSKTIRWVASVRMAEVRG